MERFRLSVLYPTGERHTTVYEDFLETLSVAQLLRHDERLWGEVLYCRLNWSDRAYRSYVHPRTREVLIELQRIA